METLEGMTTYCYQDLQDPSLGFRLIELQAGEMSDEVKFSIYHESLIPSRKPQRSSVDLGSLRKTLPPDWWVYQETSNQIYFYYENDQGDWKSQWTHPDPAFDLSPYQISQQRNPTTFEALSYTWGTSTETRTALVVPRFSDHKSEPVKTMSIGINLECALKHLRFPDRVRTLWVDAVCINQNNISERDEQVKRMATIYKEATRVVVWLGPESESSVLAIKTLAFLGQQIVMTMDKWSFTAPGATEIDWCYNATLLPYDKKTWRAINSLLQRSWFSRVWIVQEIQLAKDAVLRCGHDEMAWVEFRRAILALWGKSVLDSAISRRRLSFIERLVNPVTSTSTIYHILHRTDDRGCSNKRDRVYGVMGLFPGTFRARIQPQYFLGVGKVYLDFVRSHIEHVKRLELLRDCQLEGRTVDTPTWVPDFSISKSTVKSADWQFASGYSACEVSFTEERRLVVAGVNCGEVDISRGVPNYRSQSCQGATIQDSIKAIREIIEWIKSKVSDNRMSWHTFARTITGNYLKDRFPENSVESLRKWESYLETSPIFNSSDLSTIQEDSFSFYEEFSLGLLLGRTIIITNKDEVILGPPGTKKGDQIVCFLGCDSPIVLRPVPGSENFHVVGECFALTLKDSQAFLGPLPSPWVVQFFSNSPDRTGLYRYYNTETLELTDDDPRLERLLESGLELLESERKLDDPVTSRTFRDVSMGTILTSDPRITTETLSRRGVGIRWFSLV
ncbi:unnamed protein product [Clonostachys rosea]|uniref:Heterokaryon incompatibility domain-containing protein n=1 Tax=Bionectria ochroleuca TaxID=29856 RepID=A0ABY6UX14_BIOOC|nr:unnamed protein product [Clonostachys rosea]